PLEPPATLEPASRNTVKAAYKPPTATSIATTPAAILRFRVFRARRCSSRSNASRRGVTRSAARSMIARGSLIVRLQILLHCGTALRLERTNRHRLHAQDPAG